MRAVLILLSFVFGIVSFGLSGCSHNKQFGSNSSSDDGSAQNLNDNEAKSYALQGNSGYTGQVKRNSYGQIINPLVAPANQTYYFDLDSNMVQQSDYNALTIQADYLASHSRAKVRLEGNTDSRGSREYNVALGWGRVQAVEHFLEQHGVMKSQIDELSYGKEHPAVLGNNEYAWRLNRRVDLIYEVK